MMPALAGMDVPEEFLAFMSQDALQSDGTWATLVQVTVLDAVSCSFVHDSFGLDSSSGSLPLMRKALSSRIQSTPSYLTSGKRMRSPEGGP
jgi:hypothetical protein